MSLRNGNPFRGFLPRLRARARPWVEGARNRFRSAEVVFTEIYAQARWGGAPGEFYSGSGAHDEEIVSAWIAAVSRAADIHGFRGRTFVDLGCGDFHVGRRLLPLCSEYVGVDVVNPLVERNRAAFGNETTRFLHADIVEDGLPRGDVAVLRHVLQHLSNRQIGAVLGKIATFRWVLVTEHYPCDSARIVANRDMIHGGYVRVPRNSGVYLPEPPFRVPADSLTLLLEVPGTPLGDHRDPGLLRTFPYEPRRAGASTAPLR